MMAMMSMARTRGPGGGRQDGKGDKARMRDDGSEGDEGDEGSVGAMGGFVIETSSALGRIIPDGACETNLTAAASTEMTDTHVVAVASVRAEVYRDGFDGSLAAACRVGNDVGSAISANVTFPRADCVISGGQFHCTPASDVAAALAETSAYARASGVASALGECHCAAGADVLSFVKATQQPKHYRVRPAGEASQEETAAACPAATASNRGGWCCCGGRDRLVRSLGATEGRRHGRGGGGRGLPGAARLVRAGICPPAEVEGDGRMGRAGSPIARGRCGSCVACSSRVAVIPPRAAAMRSNAVPGHCWAYSFFSV